MSERLDLSDCEIVQIGLGFHHPVIRSSGMTPTMEQIFAEALRAQASEDALRRRVEELEGALLLLTEDLDAWGDYDKHELATNYGDVGALLHIAKTLKGGR